MTRWSASPRPGRCAIRSSRGRATSAPPATTVRPPPRYTECRLDPLAMEMVRSIDEDTVDFGPNYDGRTQEPLGPAGAVPQPARQRQRRHRRRHGHQHPAAQPARDRVGGALGAGAPRGHPRGAARPRLMERIPGPDFPTGGLIVGRSGIEDAYRTGRGLVTMRAEVEVTEDTRGRTMLVVTAAALPGQPRQPDAQDRGAGQRRQDHRIWPTRSTSPAASPCGWRSCSRGTPFPGSCSTSSTSTPSCRTRSAATWWPSSTACRGRCRSTAFVRHWIHHQVDVIQRRTRYPAAQGRGARAHPARLRSWRSTSSTRSSTLIRALRRRRRGARLA